MAGKTRKNTSFMEFSFLLISIVFVSISVFAEKIYYFVDENGVYHFTDIPDDKRYRPFLLWDNRLSKEEIKEAVYKIAKRYDIDPKLILAIIKVESNFDHLAVSPKKAQGLMQLTPITQTETGLKDPYDPYANIEAGIRYFKFLLERYKSIELALAAYNAGPTAVNRYGGIPPYKETQSYIKRVIKFYNQLKKSSFKSVKLAK